MSLPWTAGILTAPSGGGTPAFIGGFRPLNVGQPESQEFQATSVDLLTSEYFANSTAQLLNFTNAFTINCWFKSGTAVTFILFDIGGTEDSSRIQIKINNTGITVELDNAAGTLFKDWRWTGLDSTNGLWHMLTVTWDGTTITYYRNGVDAGAPATKNTDDTDSLTNASRGIYIGADHTGAQIMTGILHSAHIWDVALDADSVGVIWNHGSGATFNPLVNQDDYSEASDVVHWWRFGHNPSNIGADYSVLGSTVDVDTNAVGVTTADLVPDAPWGGHLALVTDEILRKGLGGAGGGTSTATLGVADSFSIELWVNNTTVGATTIFDANKGDSNASRDSDDRIQLRMNASNFEFRVFDASGTGVTVTSSVNARASEWYHIVLVKNGTSRASLYIDGIEDAFTTTSVPTTTDAARIIGVGGIPIGPSAFWDGQVHSVAVWSTALDAANIEQLYNGGFRTLNRRKSSGNYNATASLVHWWRFAKRTGVEGTGANYVCDQVVAGGIDLSANAANVSHTNDTGLSDTIAPVGGAVDFDGTNDFLANTTAQSVGVTNTWSVVAWVRPDAVASIDTILSVYNGSTNANRIDVRLRGDVVSDPYEVTIFGSGGVLFKQYRYFDSPGAGGWGHFATTWDGTTLLGYGSGLVETPTIITDDAVTQTATDRQVYIGEEIVVGGRKWDGRIGYVAIFNTVLSADEIRELAAHGLEFDLRSAGYVYASQASLVHFYRPGKDPNDLGNDWVSSGAIDLTATSLSHADIKINTPG